jgi:lauroyl/myristoyl acyltransferase
MRLREIFSWKFGFYRVLLPALRRLGPERADRALAAMGRAAAAWPGRRRQLVAALGHARIALGDASTGDWGNPANLAPALSVGTLRFLARDYLLETDDDGSAVARFDVSGADILERALAQGRGVVLVGGHLGGHVAAFHWLYRSGVPVRLMVQRPHHIASALNRFFDRDDADAQAGYFLRRALEPGECVARVLRARAALRAGKAIYLPGDIPWSGPNTRSGRLLGQTHNLLSVWADLAALTGAPVFFVLCTHRPNGRFALTLVPYGAVAPGGEAVAVSCYLARLEQEIAAHPGDAVAHLLWPCYRPGKAKGAGAHGAPLRFRPSRRVAIAP